MQPTLAFELDHPDDTSMNYSIYIGNSSQNCTILLTTVNDVLDGVFTYDNYYSATELGERYYWRVHVWNSTEHVNETFHFNALTGGGSVVSTPGFEMIGLLFACVVCIVIFTKSKKIRYTENNKYEEK